MKTSAVLFDKAQEFVDNTFMRLTQSQRENLGKYLLDISKLTAAIFVFASIPNKPFQLLLGAFGALLFLLVGLYFLKGGQNGAPNTADKGK